MDRISRGLEEDTFDMLVAIRKQRRERIGEVVGDLLAPRTIQEAKEKSPVAHLTFSSHVMPESGASAPEIGAAVESLHGGEPGEYDIHHEYGKKDPHDESNLRLRKSWYGDHWACNTFLRDASRADGKLFHIFSWENSHCRRVRIMPELEQVAPRLYHELTTQG
jgi:hypothetical protein